MNSSFITSRPGLSSWLQEEQSLDLFWFNMGLGRDALSYSSYLLSQRLPNMAKLLLTSSLIFNTSKQILKRKIQILTVSRTRKENKMAHRQKRQFRPKAVVSTSCFNTIAHSERSKLNGVQGTKFHSSARNYKLNLERTSNSSQSTCPVGRVLWEELLGVILHITALCSYAYTLIKGQVHVFAGNIFVPWSFLATLSAMELSKQIPSIAFSNGIVKFACL